MKPASHQRCAYSWSGIGRSRSAYVNFSVRGGPLAAIALGARLRYLATSFFTSS